MIFVGIDWAEESHAVCVMDEGGAVLEDRRVPANAEGLRWVHEAVARHTAEPSEAVVAIETDQGLFVNALQASGYQVFAINPLSVSRYRDRHTTSGQKSDPGDAKVLADLVRTDRQNHRLFVPNSKLVKALQIVTRAHQRLIWERTTQTVRLRSTLREYYPGALQAFDDLHAPDVLELLEHAPTPEGGRRLSISKISAALRRSGRHNVEQKAARIQTALRGEQLEFAPVVADAYGQTIGSMIQVLKTLNHELQELEQRIAELYRVHPEAKIYDSLPGLGEVLGPRVLAEFGDSPNRYADSRGRKSSSGMAPVTRTSGRATFVHRRVATNTWLSQACFDWGSRAIRSPGVREYYLLLRTRNKSHNQAARAVANRLIGKLHICLERGIVYDADIAWRPQHNGSGVPAT